MLLLQVFIRGFDITIAMVMVFGVMGVAGLIILKWRMRYQNLPFLQIFWREIKWAPLIGIFFASILWHMTVTCFYYFFGLKMSWGATVKVRPWACVL